MKRKQRRRRSIRKLDPSQKDSIIVIFSSRDHFFKSLQHRAVRNTLLLRRSTRSTRQNTDNGPTLSRSNIRKNNKKGGANSRRKRKFDCAPTTLTVDFEAIGWSKWIVYPKRYDARLCSGRCKSPVTWRQRPTNHAILQSLMRLEVRTINMLLSSTLYIDYSDILQICYIKLI